MIEDAFILSAGFGTRMRPLTDDKPKPMIPLNGTPLLGHALKALNQHGVKRTIINTHYLSDAITDYAKTITDPEIILSHEEDILDTGGGILNALHHIQNDSFFAINGDAFWIDPPQMPGALQALQDAWKPEVMDILILLQPVNRMTLTHGVGDYDIDGQSRAIRSLTKSGTHMFTSLRVQHKRIFNDDNKGEAFSYLKCMDSAQQNGRLYGISYDGDWHHISTPQDLEAVEAAIHNG